MYTSVFIRNNDSMDTMIRHSQSRTKCILKLCDITLAPKIHKVVPAIGIFNIKSFNTIWSQLIW